MTVISNEMQRLLATGSTLRAMFEEGKRMRKIYGADNVYDFSLGNPSTPVPQEFNDALIDVIKTTDSKTLHGYMSNAGFDETRAAIAEYLNGRYGTKLEGKNIVMTVGAANALVAAMKVLLNPGDEVIVLAPFFLEYRNYIANFGGVTVVAPPNPPAFKPDLKVIESLINEKTRALIINNPNNPSGVVYDESVLKGIAEVLEKGSEKYGRPIFLISDEPYREIVYDGLTVPFPLNYYRNTMICYSYSKSMSVPGERIGYLAVPDDVDESELILRGASIGVRVMGCVNAPSLQQLAIARVPGVTSDLSVYETNRNLLMKIMDEAGFEYVYPEGTFYLFVKTPVPDDKAFVTRAKDEYHVICSSGAAFDCPGYVRFAYCVDTAMIERSADAIIALAKSYNMPPVQ